mgnify:CR=1 FL=1|tara:strand:- start:1639 stop:2823 length:1185 start_codon:yes stop_codon:yes gene_type:complete
MENLFENESWHDMGATSIDSHLTDPKQRAWIEINPSAITANAKAIKKIISEDCLLMAVVKADGYGHGAKTVAGASLEGGADYLGVATLKEGIDLRRAGFKCPVLILSNLINFEEFELCLNWNLQPTLSTYEQALLCHKVTQTVGKIFSVHLKIDTGMTRLGCDLSEAFEIIHRIENLPKVSLAGIYSHLATADIEKSHFTQLQKDRFDELLSIIHRNNNCYCYHLANSAATLISPSYHYNMVRVGLALYGYSPKEALNGKLILKPALSVKAKISLVRDVKTGVGVSYGHSYRTTRPSRLAVIGIGYADGISRSLSGKISVIVNGKLIPQVGAITMDQMIVDITDVPNVHSGTIVTLLGQDKDLNISAHDWSQKTNTVPWEILCGFKNRLPRIVI